MGNPSKIEDFMNRIRNYFLFAFMLFVSVTFFSCQKKTVKRTSNRKNQNINVPTKLRELDDIKIREINGKSIILLLGYGFNDNEIIKKITNSVGAAFGIDSEEKSGLVSLYIYPDDFGKDEKISRLSGMIEKKDIIGMIILGAPDKTHKTIADLMDKNESRKLPYPVYSFFPQDDILGSQYISDFVVDYAGNSESSDKDIEGSEEEKTHSIKDFDVSNAIVNSIQLILVNSENDNISTKVQKILGQNHKISRYVDPETKVPAINHFVFE